MTSEDEDMELKRIRMQKMQALIKQKQLEEQKKNQKTITLADKIDMLLKVILTPHAQVYLNEIKSRNMQVYNKIRSQLFPPQISSQIDLLIAYLQKGMIRQNIIDKLEIQYLERQILGIKSQITVKKRGEDATSLSSFLKEKED